MQQAWLNGEWCKLDEARISPLDRGFLFGDGVYEVIPVYNRKVFALGPHLKRLQHSLSATRIPNPYTDDDWRKLCHDLIQRHPWTNQSLYIQVTRGLQPKRDHTPENCLVPTVFAYSNELTPLPESLLQTGIRCITVEDIRWMRCDIKAITLLPNIMMKMAAQEAGADDAILMRNGMVVEGTASNVMIVESHTLVTPPLDHCLLGGITRQVLLHVAKESGLEVKEEPISLLRLHQADEIWLTSSTKEALPVVEIDGQAVGKGVPGPIWKQMRAAYAAAKKRFVEAYDE
ncbi:MAG TPA: D-amino acid aminotransferase [Sulfurivirga caldicuralii]|nr:D-amino acid aminotransferase [Sulfurivirga caldicuralii]